MKKLLISQSDITALEIARKELHKVISSLEDENIKTYLQTRISLNISDKMWRITHKRYRQPFWNKVIISIKNFIKRRI